MKKQLVILLLLFVILFTGCTTQEVERNDLHEKPTSHNNEFLSVIHQNETLQKIVKENVSYYRDINGYLAKPQNISEEVPGILLVHEWWGLNQNIKNVADVLAGKGYKVLAVDLYNGQVAQNSSKAGELSSSINDNESIENMKAGLSYLKELENVSSIASWGWCFGGDQTAKLSLSDAQLDATIVYYGDVPTSTQNVSKMDEPILGIFGEEDSLITKEQAETFKSSLEEQQLQHQIEIYQGAGHAFANPSGESFNKNATQDSWYKTMNFLKNSLK